MLGGGGAGRTTASLKMIMAYLGYVVVLNEHLKRIEDDRRDYLRGPQSKKKDKEGSDTLDSPAVTNTDEQLSDTDEKLPDTDEQLEQIQKLAPPLTTPNNDGLNTTFERGRITLIAAHNNTVNGLHEKTLHEANNTSTLLRLCKLLVICKHTTKTKLKAVENMVTTSPTPSVLTLSNPQAA